MKLQRALRYLIPEPVQVSLRERLSTVLAAFLAILVVSLVSHHLFDHHALPWIAASMGASAVLLFALPTSPMAQPWPFIGSHLISATVGVACVLTISDPVWAGAISVALTILIMFLTHTLHPPGGASALLPIVAADHVREVGFHYVLYPVGLNVVLMLLLAVVLNRWLLGRRYPVPPYEPRDELHHHADPRTMERSGITHDDLHTALVDLDVYVDVNEEQLAQIYKRAGLHAMRRRMGEMTCEQIMSKDVVVVQRDTSLDQAWDLLQYHRLRVLPVVGGDRWVVGIVSAMDVLKGVDRRHVMLRDGGMRQLLRRALRRGPGLEKQVGDVMTEEVTTVAWNTHIADVVPLLSEGGYHHLPVVDAQQRLVGMVTQSDLIGALHTGLLRSQP